MISAHLHRRGFTLIEVLAALIIVSIGMLAVIQAVTQTVSNSAYLRDKAIAHWVAMNKLTEVRLANTALSNDETSGDSEMAGRKWRWRMAVSTTDVSSMQRIVINVAPESDDEKASIASVTGFISTAIAPAGSTRVNWGLSATSSSDGGGSSSSSSAGSSSSASSQSSESG